MDFRGFESMGRKISFFGNSITCYAYAVMGLLLLSAPANAQMQSIGLFVGDVDAYVCIRALESENMPNAEIRIFTKADTGTKEMRAFVTHMDAAVVDIMQDNPADWLLENRAIINPKAKIYAVRGSSHTQDFLDAGFVMDKTVHTYYSFTSAENLANLIRFIADQDLGISTAYEPPTVPPDNALYHPDAPKLFSGIDEYMTWYKASGKFQPDKLWNVSIIFPTFALDGKKTPLDALIREYERMGINTVCWFREMKDRDKNLEELLFSKHLSGRIGSITGFDFKFSSTLTGRLSEILQKADVPVLNAQYLFFHTGEEWLASPQGVSPADMTMQFSTPEISGLIEPSVIGVKELAAIPQQNIKSYIYVPVQPHVEILARRAAKWHALKQKANKDKKIVLVYYNHGAGKENIGASYLNVFRSIAEIIQNLKQQGYRVNGNFSEDKIMNLLIKSGRNIGSWAPGELDALLAEGNAAFVEMSDYRKWLAETPADFQEKVEKDWGKPEASKIMVKDGRFVIPCIRLGNLTLVPQPVRGWSDDPDKLYHSTVLYPHHQYAAFYFWMQKIIQPDAMISLGTHGTHEWLPGKQAGMTWQCAPEVLIGDIPSLYPYIVDDVGEGIQAKRRGRAAIIDHATPPFRRGGTYADYTLLASLISEYGASPSEKIQEAKLERIREMTTRLGLDKDLDIQEVNQDSLEKLEHYLLELKTQMIPYGLHTFGKSAPDSELMETAEAIAEKGDKPAAFYHKQLRDCGISEMSGLIRGLSGGYIPSASGNDPIRNPESLPTGKNFYAFDPEKTPSKEAWENGKKAAQELIDAYRKKHDGKYPEQVGVILWSVETIRDEGINTATALYLMGMKPVWDHRDKVKDAVPIPGSELNRPRIDVLLQMSGLFRDTFPTVALLLDKAVKKSAAMTDIENYIRKHSQELEKNLSKEGYSAEDAKKLSLVRLFSAPPGAYGTKVDNFAGASGLWDNDDIVAEQGFIKMQSFGYSSEIWGQSLTPTYRQHLKTTDATIHTISSNLYGTMDNDDMFQYLGGLSMAVRKESGKNPEVFISMQQTLGEGHVEPLAATLGREMRTRYLNPEWIKGMKRENYAGAREMSEFMENMWGWQVTAPDAVDKAKWEQTFEVYVEDKHGLEMKEFFKQKNPAAYQSMTARMLESVRKGYWAPSEEVRQKLAAEYAKSVAESGIACCDHICGNPMLNQMVADIISIPGIVPSKVAEQFKATLEKATGSPLAAQVEARAQLLESLNRSAATDPKKNPENIEKQSGKAADAAHTVQGYRMEKVQQPENHPDMKKFSGIQWFAALFLLLLAMLFTAGTHIHSKAMLPFQGRE
ncbi:MAG: cobaltochelatase subunit CobN [Desulfococcaceae bacterium]